MSSDSTEIVIQLFSGIGLVCVSLLLVPQAVHNYRRSTTDGMSAAMIVWWLIGSICPAAYLMYTNQPILLITAWFVFIFNSVIILCQVKYYSNKQTKTNDKDD